MVRLLSLIEPWATLMAIGAKHVETRDWSTVYRGPLAIHASKNFVLERTLEVCLQPHLFKALQEYEPFRVAVLKHCPTALFEGDTAVAHPNHIPKSAMKEAFPEAGRIRCIVNLTDCVPAATFKASPRFVGWRSARELAFGNYDDTDKDTGQGRVAWITEMIFRLPEPIPFISKQGLVVPDMETQELMKAQWRKANL